MAQTVSVLFVCLGNICRSPMAEFLFLDMLQKEGMADRVKVSSAATSTWEIGNPPHRGTRELLSRLGISCKGKKATHLQKSDYDCYEYIIGMDQQNLQDMLALFGGDPQGKVWTMLSLCGENRDVKDPWYTGNFEATHQDIEKGLQSLLLKIKKQL